MADERDRLPLDPPDAAERIAAEDALIRRLGDVTLIAVGEQPILGAIARSRRRRKYETACLGSERRRFAVPFDQGVRPVALRRERDAESGDHEAERAGARLPETEPQAAQNDEYKRET